MNPGSWEKIFGIIGVRLKIELNLQKGNQIKKWVACKNVCITKTNGSPKNLLMIEKELESICLFLNIIIIFVRWIRLKERIMIKSVLIAFWSLCGMTVWAQTPNYSTLMSQAKIYFDQKSMLRLLTVMNRCALN